MAGSLSKLWAHRRRQRCGSPPWR